MKFGSLFAGIGGFDLGMERAGMTCAWQVEIDDYCRKVLAKHWPDVDRYEDVREVGAHNLAPVDLICGGFPCQDISPANTAGERRGLDGKKSSLWREMNRVISEIRPTWVVVENNSHRWRAWMPEVRRELKNKGYLSIGLRLHFGDFGTNHNRKRAFVVANANDDSESMFAIYEKVAGMSPVPGEVWDGGDTPRDLRTDDGLPNRVDRLRGLGNAVVPQVAEYVGRLIMDQRDETEDDNGWQDRNAVRAVLEMGQRR